MPTLPRPIDPVERDLRKLPLVRACLRHLNDMLGITAGQVGLDLGGLGGVISMALRRRGGAWCSMDAPGAPFESLRRLTNGENVYPIESPRLPFPDQSFDVMVALDIFQHTTDEAALVEECHRVLKPAGRLIVQTPFARAGSLVPALCRMTGVEDPWASRIRGGYTQPRLFGVLKDGFDVQDARTYGGPLSTWGDCALRASAWRAGEDPRDVYFAWARRARQWAPLAWLSAMIDPLFPASRGHRLIVRAKRRLWIPRKTPVLRDGRSIAEATLQTKIGTASALSQIMAPRERNQIRTRR
jgi:SAM-dependent methyltransferase